MPNSTPYFLGLALVALAVAWLPLVLRRTVISWPLAAFVVGFGLFYFLDPKVKILEFEEGVDASVEIALIVAVMGAGLKIDRRFSWAGWGSVWRLLAVAMPVSVLAISAGAHYILAAPLGVALLIGGMLAPTDPVLASDVGLGPPGRGEEGEVRFALTAEAGLNDGLAFPFVSLGLLILGGEALKPHLAVQWILIDLFAKTLGAVLTGCGIGWLLVWVNARLPEDFRLSHSGDWLVLVAVSFLAYALTQLIGAYGFVAVFACAVAIRNFSELVQVHRRLNDSADQIERFAAAIVIIFLGGSVAQGALSDLTVNDAVLCLFALFVVRPAAVALSFMGSPLALRERVALSYFGIRGLGTLFYLAYAHNDTGGFSAKNWPVVLLVVLVSIFLYGFSSGLVLEALGLCNESDGSDGPRQA